MRTDYESTSPCRLLPAAATVTAVGTHEDDPANLPVLGTRVTAKRRPDRARLHGEMNKVQNGSTPDGCDEVVARGRRGLREGQRNYIDAYDQPTGCVRARRTDSCENGEAIEFASDGKTTPKREAYEPELREAGPRCWPRVRVYNGTTSTPIGTECARA